MSEHLCDLPAHDIAKKVRSGQLKAVDVLASTFVRIDAVEGKSPSSAQYNPDPEDLKKVHAYITITRERAQAQAEAIDNAVNNGDDPGLLAGVPVAIKDIFCVQGTPSTAGSRILESFISPYSATPARRLEEAGGTVLGSVHRPLVKETQHSTTLRPDWQVL